MNSVISGNHHSLEWSAVADMFREILARLPQFSSEVTGSIRKAFPVYSLVLWEDHHRAVESQLRSRLSVLIERRLMNSTELAGTGRLASERASQGIPIDALIGAYQMGDKAIWQEVTEKIAPDMLPVIPEVGQMIFAVTSAITEVMAAAHSRVMRELDGGRITLAHHFLELLKSGERPEAIVVATRLGLNPNGDFLGMVWEPETSVSAQKMITEITSSGVKIVIRAVGEHRFEMVAQAAKDGDLYEYIKSCNWSGMIGIGLVRVGLEGASISLSDAKYSFERTNAMQPIILFEDDWITAILISERNRTEKIIGSALAVAQAQPHLAETLMIFAQSNMSIATTAQVMHLHANSVTYRLNRWHHLSGLDARTFNGLAQSVVACVQVKTAAKQ